MRACVRARSRVNDVSKLFLFLVCPRYIRDEGSPSQNQATYCSCIITRAFYKISVTEIPSRNGKKSRVCVRAFRRRSSKLSKAIVN